MTKNKEYIKFLNDLKSKIKQTQYQTYRAVNKELISLYWDIGKSIVDKQKKLGWGQKIIQQLAEDLQKEFPKNSGFSYANLDRMRKFYLTYKNNPKLAQLVREIHWGQNIVILEKLNDNYQREYYLRMGIRSSWSRSILVHQIESKSFERFLIDKKAHNFDSTLPIKILKKAEPIIKDTYMLDFLEISDDIKEKELEKKLLENIKSFLLELGIGFAFIGSQYKIMLNESEYFIDLLFYHRYLKCLVAIDLKIGKFIPEYAGKMNFYLNLLDDKVKLQDENPSIGLILCKKKDNIVVEYSLRNIKKPVGVAKYYLTRKLPAKLLKQLPSPSVIENKLKELEGEK
ncbi:MAG: PDDEXK nuclease domain-containing protein [bacterium]|nr:PDDEXK nuclease domain-containing protein [bacterium]